MNDSLAKNLVVACEPQFTGYEHAKFNASMLKSILDQDSAMRLKVVGDHAHLEALWGHLEGEQHRIELLEVTVLPRGTPFKKRVVAEWVACSRSLHLAIAVGGAPVLFLSASSTFLFIAKIQMLVRRFSARVVVVPHAVQNSVLSKAPKRFVSRLVSFRNALRFPHPRNLRYVALGGRIHETMYKVAPRAAKWFCHIDPPYFLAEPSTACPVERRSAPLFGFLGVSMKGFDAFVTIVRHMRDRGYTSDQCRFSIAGFVNSTISKDDLSKLGALIQGVSISPLSDEEYSRRVWEMTYAVVTSKPEEYRLRCCATFLDCMSFVKPAIYLRNEWIEHYFEKMGDIGYLCSDVDEIKKTMISIIDRFPVDRYVAQCDNILRTRELFSTRAAAAKMREILAEAGGRR